MVLQFIFCLVDLNKYVLPAKINEPGKHGRNNNSNLFKFKHFIVYNCCIVLAYHAKAIFALNFVM